MKDTMEKDLKEVIAAEDTAKIILIIGGIHMIFPFSRNGPANYKFSLFSKLPTNYPKISEKIPKTYVKIPRSGIFRCVNCIFSEIFG